MVVGGIVTIILGAAVVVLLLRTGGAKSVTDNAALIGALVALGGVFTAQMVSIALDERRTQEARDLEAQRASESALQNYLEVVGELLIEKPLRRARPGDNLSTVLRAQTLSVLEGLVPNRKGILLQFLYESGLIHQDKQVVSLEGANLRGANLIGVNLVAANLNGVNLNGAHLFRVNLNGANLRGANLWGADLRGVNLIGANLVGVKLFEADLQGAILRASNFELANFLGADLNQADLTHAQGVTNEQLEQQASSLEGATMPDGQKYEDWLKSKGHGEDREDRGSS
jgi:uncharacterized protein YjbI with pentapeptide repeats